jgi:putative IMPACT (imprinted ancient) family translation regulator
VRRGGFACPAGPRVRALCYRSGVRIERTAEFSVTVERSRFYALLAPLASPAAIDALLKTRRRDYRKANHHCWASRVRDAAAGTVVEASKDDGEVGHPGRVLLELLKKHDLEGALVVSRIFGGVKLGVGGVSRAFRDAGQGAINRLLG